MSRGLDGTVPSAKDDDPLPSPLADAARVAVDHLQQDTPLDLWVLARSCGAAAEVVAASGPWSPAAAAGSRLQWLGEVARRQAAGASAEVRPGVPVLPGVAAEVRPGVPVLPGVAAEVRPGVPALPGVPVLPGDGLPGMPWHQTAGCVAVPLLGSAGELVGVLCGLTSRRDDAHLTDAVPQVRVLARLLASLLSCEQEADVARQERDRVRTLSEIDVLTGLRNRRGWYAGLSREERRCARYDTPAGVVAMDLDRLKAVNDAHGHAAGDRLLERAARVLVEVCRPSDTVARPGGDEFTVLAVEADARALQALTTRLRAALDGAGVAASVGGAVRSGSDGLIGTWMRADRAMLADKRRRRALLACATPDAGAPAGGGVRRAGPVPARGEDVENRGRPRRDERRTG